MHLNIPACGVCLEHVHCAHSFPLTVLIKVKLKIIDLY